MLRLGLLLSSWEGGEQAACEWIMVTTDELCATKSTKFTTNDS